MAAPKRPNPVGAKSDKEWRNAIRKAVHELRAADEGDLARKVKALTLIARRLITRAVKGDVAAMKEIRDRLDGRPTVAVDMTVSEPITKVEHVIIDPERDTADAIVRGLKGETAETGPPTSNGSDTPA